MVHVLGKFIVKNNDRKMTSLSLGKYEKKTNQTYKEFHTIYFVKKFHFFFFYKGFSYLCLYSFV